MSSSRSNRGRKFHALLARPALSGVLFILSIIASTSAAVRTDDPAITGPGPYIEIFVSTFGNDAWTGTLPQPNAAQTDGPFATFERARDAIRQLHGAPRTDRGIIVWIRGGIYLRERTFELTAADSGSITQPIVYRPYPDETVRILGGKPITGFTPVTDDAILQRLDVAARSRVMQVNLTEQGIREFGSFSPRGFHLAIQPAGLELFFNGTPMPVAAWPKRGFATIATVPAGSEGGRFTCESDRFPRWVDSPDVWVHGYWGHDWADSYEKVRAIDVAKHEIAVQPPFSVYGYVPKQRFQVINALPELDTPGEWYLERSTGILYFWPPTALDRGQAIVSMMSEPMLKISDATNVTFRGLRFECSRGAGAIIVGGSHILIAGCTFTNLGTFAVSVGDHYENLTDAIDVDSTLNRNGGTENGVISCDISHTGEGGIMLGGGDRKTLAPGSNFAINNRITDFARWVRTYRAAIEVDGVANHVAHNYISDGPHVGILLKGNDHLVEYNHVEAVCSETADVGAFYMGRDFSERGNVVRYNLFRDIGVGAPSRDVNAIYIDDCASGTHVFANVIYKSGRGVKIGGGRDNNIDNNLLIACDMGIYVDSRGLSWMKNYFDGTTSTLFDRLKAVNFSQPPFSRHYPELSRITRDEPAEPRGNRIIRNVCTGGPWTEFDTLKTEDLMSMHDNFHISDPGVMAPEKSDFRLRPGSPVWQIGFKPIPLTQIGPQPDEYDGDRSRDTAKGKKEPNEK